LQIQPVPTKVILDERRHPQHRLLRYISGNFKLEKKIEDLNEFWDVLKTQKSFYAKA
jgi:RNAse (barnase) inhibitor barstar